MLPTAKSFFGTLFLLLKSRREDDISIAISSCSKCFTKEQTNMIEKRLRNSSSQFENDKNDLSECLQSLPLVMSSRDMESKTDVLTLIMIFSIEVFSLERTQ